MSLTRNPNLGPSQMRARKRRLFFIRFYIVLFFFLVVVLGLAILSGHEKVKIRIVDISGNAAVSDDQILDIVSRDMAGRYFYLFSKSNSLIFPRFRIRMDILNEIKTIKDVDISWKDWGKISIIIEERKPHSVWCGEDPNINIAKCFFLDKNGYIYSQAPNFSGSLFIKYYGSLLPSQIDDANQMNPIGSYFLPSEIYKQIVNLISIIDQNNLKVWFVFYDGFDFRFNLDLGPVIIFNSQDNFSESFSNFFTAIETKNLDLEKDSTSISYIDLRFANKIIIGKKEN